MSAGVSSSGGEDGGGGGGGVHSASLVGVGGFAGRSSAGDSVGVLMTSRFGTGRGCGGAFGGRSGVASGAGAAWGGAWCTTGCGGSVGVGLHENGRLFERHGVCTGFGGGAVGTGVGASNGGRCCGLMDGGGAVGTGVGAYSGGRWSLVVGGRAALVVGGVGVGIPSSTTMSESQIVKSGGGTALAVS